MAGGLATRRAGAAAKVAVVIALGAGAALVAIGCAVGILYELHEQGRAAGTDARMGLVALLAVILVASLATPAAVGRYVFGSRRLAAAGLAVPVVLVVLLVLLFVAG